MLNALDIDRWYEALQNTGGISTRSIDQKSQDLLRKLFDVTAKIKETGQNNMRSFWITAKRCSFDEYVEAGVDEDADISKEDLRKWYREDFPDETVWYPVSLQHVPEENGYEEFFGVFFNHRYILSIGDANTSGYPVDVAEFIKWLIDKAEEVMQMLGTGTYNEYVRDNLPAKYRFGRISRKDYWDIDPKKREDYRTLITENVIGRFLRHVKIPCPDGSREITARDYYEACAIGYTAAALDKSRNIAKEDYCKERLTRLRFQDSDAEHERYGGFTPKEMYYAIADGRDNGLSAVPLDDPTAFDEWLDKKGAHYSFNGNHPWEIRGSFSMSSSIHLSVRKDRQTGKKSYLLSGDAFWTSVETIRMFTAMRENGLPVALTDADVLVARLTETDDIGILPKYLPEFYARYGNSTIGYDVVDFTNLYNEEQPEKICEKARWVPEEKIELST